MNTAVKYLTKRNIHLFFKDKGTLLGSILSPLIIFVLYISFLKNVYIQSFEMMIPEGVKIAQSVINSFAGCWLMSSIIAVSSVTVAFCSNIIMAQDKINGARSDLLVTPIKKSQLALAYYFANVATTMIVCFIAAAVGFIYIAIIGWYFSFTDILLIILDIILAVLFGTAAAALVDSYISSQGGIGAVSTIISSLYGFLCGAYMPISQLGESFRDFVMFIPGTYATGLLRNHYMSGVLNEIKPKVPEQFISGLRDGFDANLYFFDNKVSLGTMYTVIILSIILVLGIYIIINKTKKAK